MNRDNRRDLRSLTATLESALGKIEYLRDEVQERLENLQEQFPEGPTAEALDEVVDGLADSVINLHYLGAGS